MLRPYQNDIYHQVVSLIRKGRRRILIVSVTGSGKTVLASHFLKNCFNKGNSALFNVHRVELVKQSAETFLRDGFPFGIIAPSFSEEYGKAIQVASIMTLSRRMQKLNKRPNVVIWDECHHLAADNWSRIFHHFPDAIHIGLTATPERLDGKGLGEYFEEMVLGPSMADLISDGYLTGYKLKSTPERIDTSKIGKRMGDYISTDLALEVNTPRIRGNTLKQWQKHALGMKTLVFGQNVAHSVDIAELFTSAGYKAEHIDGGADKGHRAEAIARYKNSETTLLSNVDLFGEGFDVPATQAIIKLRKTLSFSLDRQVSGRVLRAIYHPRYTKEDLLQRDCRLQAIADSNKPFGIIIDQVRNFETHGLPDDEVEWSLAGRKKNEERAITTKECPKCYEVEKSYVKKCSNCGHIFVQAPVREIDLSHTDEDLIDIDVEKLKLEKKKQQAVAQSKDELVALAISRGSKRGNAEKWAQYVLAGREKKKQKQDGSYGR